MMRRLAGWTAAAVGAAVICAGATLPASPQDVSDRPDRREARQDVRQDRRDGGQEPRDLRQDRDELLGARQQLREAYKSGDPGAIKAARERYQKARAELRREAGGSRVR